MQVVARIELWKQTFEMRRIARDCVKIDHCIKVTSQFGSIGFTAWRSCLHPAVPAGW